MDVFLLLVLAFAGLIAFWRILDFVVKVDSNTRRTPRKKDKQRFEQAWNEIVEELKRDKPK